MEILDRKTITIEKFEKIINSHKYEMTEIMILYNMSCHDNYKKLTTTQKYNLMTFTGGIIILPKSKAFVVQTYKKK